MGTQERVKELIKSIEDYKAVRNSSNDPKEDFLRVCDWIVTLCAMLETEAQIRMAHHPDLEDMPDIDLDLNDYVDVSFDIQEAK